MELRNNCIVEGLGIVAPVNVAANVGQNVVGDVQAQGGCTRGSSIDATSWFSTRSEPNVCAVLTISTISDVYG